mmetsp:Transcript_8942/g.25006  ORF Transcript_8942/g.25006 Transcript_8942/m.25006 type:complete len:82 (+) Transcript_8942:12-257(+)
MSTRGQREAARTQAQILEGRVRHWEKKWTPADGKNKSSVYKWMPAEGDVESSPSERAAQFEAVPIGEVTVAMPAKTQKPAS